MSLQLLPVAPRNQQEPPTSCPPGGQEVCGVLVGVTVGGTGVGVTVGVGVGWLHAQARCQSMAAAAHDVGVSVQRCAETSPR